MEKIFFISFKILVVDSESLFRIFSHVTNAFLMRLMALVLPVEGFANSAEYNTNP